MPQPLTILGAGYVGSALRARHPSATATHRPGKPLHAREIPFALEDESTWSTVPAHGAHVVWTFPAKPLVLVERFYEQKLKAAHSLIVLGSTSAYLTASPGETVTEDTPLDLSQERVAGEELLRLRGATVLQLAGIFGPHRDPLAWLRKGLIRNGRKWVNLIHVDDIVAAIDALVAAPQPGVRINASNGVAPAWNELVAAYQARGELTPDFALPQAEPGLENKRVANERLRRLLPGRTFRVP